jgi:hypothetical protein
MYGHVWSHSVTYGHNHTCIVMTLYDFGTMNLDGTHKPCDFDTVRMNKPLNCSNSLGIEPAMIILMENKIATLQKAITRTARAGGPLTALLCREQKKVGVVRHAQHCLACRFVRLWQARNRRTRVMMERKRSRERAMIMTAKRLLFLWINDYPASGR